MAGRVEKTVFISYRRTNLPWALFIYQNLTMHGYDVFFDYQSIDSGSFEKVILDNIRARAHFVLILTPSALERCKNPGDWLRREIETAIDEKRNIVPLMIEGFDFGGQYIKESLTGKLSLISGINALSVPNDYALEAMERLRERFLNKAIDDVALPSLQPETEKATEIQKSAANEAAPVQEEQLTAQTWFERGYLFHNDNNFEEAYRCYSEAIRLDPKLDRAYYNLGVLLYGLKRNGESEAAYHKAIELNPFDDAAYYNLGVLLHELKHNDRAEVAYRKAIELNPSDGAAYYGLGYLLRELERKDEAEVAYRKAIELNPSDGVAYHGLGYLLRELKRNEEAETAYRKAIELNPSDGAAYSNLGDVLCELKRFEDAEVTYYKAIELNSENYHAHFALASINKHLGKEIPKENIEKVRQLMPEDDWYDLACLESISDNFDLAFEYLEKASKKEKFDCKWAWEDPDLQWIRDDPRFIKIVGAKPE